MADTVFLKNYLTVSWPNFSQTGSRVADLEFKTYSQLALIFILRKQREKILGSVYNTKAVKVDAYQGGTTIVTQQEKATHET